MVHSSYVEGSDPSTNAIGSGPYVPTEVIAGQRAVLVRAPNHTWWGGTAPLDEIHYIDFGTDPSTMVSLAAEKEATLGKPVIAINTATYWHGLRACGIDDRVQGLGRLLSEF